MFCQNCGTKLIDGAQFCSECGARQLITAPNMPPAAPHDEPPDPVSTDSQGDSQSELTVGLFVEDDQDVDQIPPYYAANNPSEDTVVIRQSGAQAGLLRPNHTGSFEDSSANFPAEAPVGFFEDAPAGFQQAPQSASSNYPAQGYRQPVPAGATPDHSAAQKKNASGGNSRPIYILLSVLFAAAILFITLFAFLIPSCRSGASDQSGGTSVQDTPADTDDLIDADTGSHADSYSHIIPVRWLLDPNLNMDNIDVLYCRYPETNRDGSIDINSEGMHKLDRVCLFENDGKYGLINYNGGIVSGYKFRTIYLGTEGRYIMQLDKDHEVYYTFTELCELRKLTDAEFGEEYVALRPSFFWIEDKGLCIMQDGYPIPYSYRSDSGFLSVPHYSTYSDGSLKSFRGYILLSDGEPISSTLYDNAGSFSCGVIPVCTNGRWGYLDTEGNQVLPFEFDAPGCWGNSFKDRPVPYNASGGYITVYKGGEYAMYDVDGNLIIDFGTVDQLRPVYDGMCWAQINGKWGVLAIDDDARLPEAVYPDSTIAGTVKKVSSDNGLRMREGPGTDYCVIDILSNHEEVVVCGYSGEWAYVRADGDVYSIYGWVMSEFLV